MDNSNDSGEFNIEDEISQIYATHDMKQEKRDWVLHKAYEFYSDFESVDISQSINSIQYLIDQDEITAEVATETLGNMITLFESTEEYEKCDVCNKIKKGIENATI